MIKRVILLLALCGPIALLGCEALPIFGPSISAYVFWRDGQARAYFSTDSNSAYLSTKRILQRLNYTIVTDEFNPPDNYYLVAESNDRFKINIVQVEPYVTRVDIRINFIGDKPYAEYIYKQLEREIDVIEYTDYSSRFRRHHLGDD